MSAEKKSPMNTGSLAHVTGNDEIAGNTRPADPQLNFLKASHLLSNLLQVDLAETSLLTAVI